MDAQARAGIDLYGRVMRYAEVEQFNGRYRLLRLGSCDFEFEAARELFEEENPAHLDTVAEAIGDVFSGTVATELRLAVHPPVGQVFFSPCEASLPEAACRARFEREAALLGGQEPAAFHLAVDAAREQVLADETVRWYQVLMLPRRIHTRLEKVLRVLPAPRRRSVTSMQGVAQVVNRLAQRAALTPAGRPFVLAVGWYPSHTEYCLCEGGAWQFCHHAPAGPPSDALYFALALLVRQRIEPGQVGRVFFYGVGLADGAGDLFAQVFGVTPEKLNAVPVVDLDPGSLSASFDVEAYAPCLGITL
ncbi:hypothetical protein GQ464_014175 [Rhodocaloribacter litoris]|uniref:hypothetical protein n=1 Tax=Rhodocaloribacter litoris TaxID=2558931 RepID=UPI0014233E52|nr:hypothetical protein [Rhodocaloribacter litoris]QXD14566.1 hypothetical protein GQ464_014175 [Rhodocaloribacter litoris]GIV59664.1 MAG: hypothetical protein KatS3mg043_0753 [Rhodothermaceae bacterium]